MTTTARRPTQRSAVVRGDVPDIKWMAEGACLSRGDLPWIADPEQATAWERLAMAGACLGCPVLTDCDRYATREKVTAGFWAGKNHDPDNPTGLTGPGWASQPLPGLSGVGGAA